MIEIVDNINDSGIGKWNKTQIFFLVVFFGMINPVYDKQIEESRH